MFMTVFSHLLIETTTHIYRREKRREFIYDCAEIRRRNNNKGWRVRETLKKSSSSFKWRQKADHPCRVQENSFSVSLLSLLRHTNSFAPTVHNAHCRRVYVYCQEGLLLPVH